MATLKRKVTLRQKTQSPIGPPIPPPAPTSNRRWKWAIGLGLFLVGGALVYSFWPQSDKSSQLFDEETQSIVESLNVDSLLKKELLLSDSQISSVVENLHKDSLFLSVCRSKGVDTALIAEQDIVKLWRDFEVAVVVEAGKRLSLSPKQLAVSTLYRAYKIPQDEESVSIRSGDTTNVQVLPTADGFKKQVVTTEHSKSHPVANSTMNQHSSLSCFFAFDSAQPSNVQALKGWAKTLKGSSKHITISSYADVTGDSGYNLELSKRRAESIRQVLISEGISTERIVLQAMGETDGFGAKSQNRRADLVSN